MSSEGRDTHSENKATRKQNACGSAPRQLGDMKRKCWRYSKYPAWFSCFEQLDKNRMKEDATAQCTALQTVRFVSLPFQNRPTETKSFLAPGPRGARHTQHMLQHVISYHLSLAFSRIQSERPSRAPPARWRTTRCTSPDYHQ